MINCVFHALEHNDLFILKWEISGLQWGIRPLVRKVGAMRMLVYGDTHDQLDEHLQLSESSMCNSMLVFCRFTVDEFRAYYLFRCLNVEEKKRALDVIKLRGFPGCFASWDCKHYFWRNCPVQLSGQYKGKENGNSIVMEAIYDPFYTYGILILEVHDH